MTIENALHTLSSQHNVHFKDLLSICMHFFDHAHTNGSHHIFKSPLREIPLINIQPHGNMAKPYQVHDVKLALKKLQTANDCYARNS